MNEGEAATIEETLTNILSIFYPEDKELHSLLFAFESNDLFEASLKQWFISNKDNYNPLDPFNKFYGITEVKPEKINDDFALNKDNTDALFSLIRSAMINEEKQLKDSIRDAFDLYTIDKISFVANKHNNTHSDLPINFYSFALSLKVLMQYYQNQFNIFSIGLFDSLFSFEETKEELFPYDLYCSYLLFIYFYEKSQKFNKTIQMTLLTNSSVYEGFTYHIIEMAKAKQQLPSSMQVNAIGMIDFICKSSFMTIILYIINSKITGATLTQLMKLFQSPQLKIISLSIHAHSSIINAFDVSFFNVHSITLVLLNKGEIKLTKDKDNKSTNYLITNRIRSLAIEGNDVSFRALPSSMNRLSQFSYITKASSMDISSLQTMMYIRSLTLKGLNHDQFILLIQLDNITLLTDIELEVIDDNKDILLNIDDFLTKTNYSSLNQIRIMLRNKGVMLSKYNGFYFIKTVQMVLPKCSLFILTNHTQFDLESHNKERECEQCSIKQSENCQVYQDEFDMVTYYGSYALNEDEVKSNWNNKKKTQVFNMTNYYMLMLCIEKKYPTLKKRPILVNIKRFLCQPMRKLLLVGNFID